MLQSVNLVYRRLSLGSEPVGSSGKVLGWYISMQADVGSNHIVQELCESRGGRPGLSVLTSLLVSVDVKNY